MDTKRSAIATIVGCVVLYAVGYLIWDLAFAGFFAANAGSATEVNRAAELTWAVLLGDLAYSALIAYALVSGAGSISIGQGAKIGAIVGFLLWFTADFTLYGVTNMANLTRTIVDPLLESIRGAIAGAIIAAVLGPKSGGGDA